MIYEYLVTKYKVIDGDSVHLTLSRMHKIDIGFNVHQEILSSAFIKCRLLGINAPELRKESNEVALLAKQRLEELMALGEVRAITHKPDPKDKYGRWLVELFVNHKNEAGDILEYKINDVLVEELLAVPYMGD